jgi:uncharacterized membrane protein
MSPTVLEWLNLAFRWAHVVAAIMWIGDSFLFMWLDTHLERPRKPREGDVQGELWMTHSGGFYEVVKRKSLRPEEMPPRLYWFKWESYTTWLTGFFLITVVYYLGAGAMLVEPGGPFLHAEAVALSIVLLGLSVVFYDLLCRTGLAERIKLFGLLGVLLAMGLTWALGHVFTPRAAFLQVGAMLATIMSSNVLLRIIPAQKHMLAMTRAGRPVDTSYGARAKLHSTHNHYLTLPVLFLMLSNHFPSLYGSQWPWAVVGLVGVVGVGAKLFMNQRLRMHPVKLVGTAAALATVVYLTLPAAVAPPVLDASGEPVAYDAVHRIIQTRCATCHATNPSDPSFPVAPVGIVLESPGQIHALRDRILARAVHTRTMPLGNLTGMTEEERGLVGTWVAQGAKLGPIATPGPTGVDTRAEPDRPTAIGEAPPDPIRATPVAAPSPPKTPKEAALATYKLRCEMCHGATGDGSGSASAALNPKPRNFGDPAWQKSVTDEHLRKVIVRGGPAVGLSPLMPPAPDLASQPEVLDALVGHVRGFAR